MVADDRRRFQRLRLSKPILALMQGHNVLILDIGMNGAFIEHHGAVTPGDRFNVAFRWQGQDIEYVCEVARTSVVRDGDELRNAVSHTGLRFIEPVGESEDLLQDLIATFIGKVLAAQKANASGDATHATILAQIGEARRSRTRGFISFRLKDDNWWRVPTSSSKQPVDGFTVAAHEDDDELEKLCSAYAQGDEETRRMIRMVAELSTMTVTERA